MKAWGLAAMALWLAFGAPAAAEQADDDLATVRKATGGAAVARAERTGSAAVERTAAAREETARPARARDREPHWLRVRVVEKSGKRARVSVNLPLVVARLLGDDWPIHGCRRCESRGTTVGEVLRALDAGEALVEIDDEDASVRVWVD